MRKVRGNIGSRKREKDPKNKFWFCLIGKRASEDKERNNFGNFFISHKKSRKKCFQKITRTLNFLVVLSLTLPFLYTHPHTHTHTLPLSLTISLSRTLTLSHAFSLKHTLYQTHSLSHTLSRTLSLTHTITHTLSLLSTHTGSHTYSLSHTHTQSPPSFHSFFLSLTLSFSKAQINFGKNFLMQQTSRIQKILFTADSDKDGLNKNHISTHFISKLFLQKNC